MWYCNALTLDVRETREQQIVYTALVLHSYYEHLYCFKIVDSTGWWGTLGVKDVTKLQWDNTKITCCGKATFGENLALKCIIDVKSLEVESDLYYVNILC
jgi:hypothetical protein